MAALTCRFCRVEMVPVALADGSVAIVCIGCDLIGLAHEIGQGAAPWPTDAAPPPETPHDRKKRPASKAA
jgi:hypothetical protein